MILHNYHAVHKNTFKFNYHAAHNLIIKDIDT